MKTSRGARRRAHPWIVGFLVMGGCSIGLPPIVDDPDANAPAEDAAPPPVVTVDAPVVPRPVDAAVPRLDAADAAAPHDAGDPADAGAPDVIVTATADAAPGAEGGTDACETTVNCARGLNCRKGRCVAATASCSAEKAADPAAPDGLYWISPAGSPLRAYCDMTEGLELCTESMAEHKGVMREPSKLAFKVTSILDVIGGSCRVWGLKGGPGENPIGFLARGNPVKTADTCALMGFKGAINVATCQFGSDPGHTDCGYPAAAFLRYGTVCTGCDMNGGQFDRYVLQGPIHAGTVVGTADQRITSVCSVF